VVTSHQEFFVSKGVKLDRLLTIVETDEFVVVIVIVACSVK
jgi:hypothetical protein